MSHNNPITPESKAVLLDQRIHDIKRALNLDTLCAGNIKRFSATDGYRQEYGFGNNSSLITVRYLWFTVKLWYLYIYRSVNSRQIKK